VVAVVHRPDHSTVTKGQEAELRAIKEWLAWDLANRDAYWSLCRALLAKLEAEEEERKDQPVE
jgi:hypothetical protein